MTVTERCAVVYIITPQRIVVFTAESPRNNVLITCVWSHDLMTCPHCCADLVPSIECYKYNNIRPPYTYAYLIRWVSFCGKTLTEGVDLFVKLFKTCPCVLSNSPSWSLQTNNAHWTRFTTGSRPCSSISDTTLLPGRFEHVHSDTCRNDRHHTVSPARLLHRIIIFNTM